MIDGGIGGGGGGGGMDPTALAGYATQSWVDGSYLSKAFFNQLFEVHTSTTTTVKDSGGTIISGPTTVEDTNPLTPNTIPGTTETTDETTGNVTTVTVAITSIEAKKGLWTNFFISALGKNASGTGGVLSLNDLVDVELSSPSNGQALVYNATSQKWENQTIGGGGGGGTLTSIGLVMPTGFAVSPATLTANGSFTVTFATGYALPTTAKQTNWDAVYNWYAENPLSGYATQTWVSQNYLSIAFFARLFQAYNGTTAVNPNDTTTTIDNIKAMFGFWTEKYLSALGKNASGASTSLALGDLVNVELNSPTDGQVLMYNAQSQKWINGTVSGGGGGTVTSITAGTGLSGGTITTSGTIAIDSTYQSYISHGETAYGWGNHADAGYLSNQTTWWGQQVSNGAVTGNLSSVIDITMSGELYMDGGKHIYFKSGNSYLNAFEFDNTQVAIGYGFRTTNNTHIYGQNVIFFANGTEKARVTSSGLQIGDAVLVYESANNALKVIKSDGTAINFYATGGVSALGLTPGTIGSIANLSVTTQLTVASILTINQKTVNNVSEIAFSTGGDNISFSTDNTGFIKMDDMCSLYGDNLWKIDSIDGYAYFNRYYLDSSRYLYVSSGTLYYYNGTTSKQVAFTN